MRYTAKVDAGGLGVVMSVSFFAIAAVILVLQKRADFVAAKVPSFWFPLFLYLLGLTAVTTYLLWLFLGVPSAVVWPEGGMLHLEARRRIGPIDPSAVKSVSRTIGFAVLQHEQGKVLLNREYVGESELKARLAKVNSYADLRYW